MIRNLPVVSSSISWSRTLYNKIEKTMNMLNFVKIVTELKVCIVEICCQMLQMNTSSLKTLTYKDWKDYPKDIIWKVWKYVNMFALHAFFFIQRYTGIVKSYNKLATILLCFEENWVSLWRLQTEQVISKLLDLTLLAQNSKENNKVIVFANPRYVLPWISFSSFIC